MKKAFIISLSAAMAICVASCKKNSETNVTTKLVSIDTVVSSGSSFALALGAYGNHAVISKQADQYSISNIKKLSTSSQPVYTFSSSSKTASVQLVTLTVTDSSRCRQSHDSTLVSLTLRVL